MTQSTEQERASYEDGAWYWVEKEGWHDEPPEIAPAMYRANSKAWYSFRFGGIPTRELKVLEPCIMQAARRAPVVPEEIADFIRRVADQAPEKPDYWSSCSQCGHNTDIAEDLLPLLAAAPQPPEATVNHSLTVDSKEAAPVQLPEPAVPYAIFDCHGFYVDMTTKAEAQSFCDHHNKRDADGGGSAPYTVQALYTEQQVRQILSTLQK